MNSENVQALLAVIDDGETFTVRDRGLVLHSFRLIAKGTDMRDTVNKIVSRYGIGPIFEQGELHPMEGEDWDGVVAVLKKEEERLFNSFH